jgi:hypothetical protein
MECPVVERGMGGIGSGELARSWVGLGIGWALLLLLPSVHAPMSHPEASAARSADWPPNLIEFLGRRPTDQQRQNKGCNERNGLLSLRQGPPAEVDWMAGGGQQQQLRIEVHDDGPRAADQSGN